MPNSMTTLQWDVSSLHHNRSPLYPPLGLVPKHDGGFRRIHNLSHPGKESVNDNICDDYSSLKYSIIDDVLQMVRIAGQHCFILKRDLKDAFRNIPVAPHIQWLLGFEWRGVFYKETCLPFGPLHCPIYFQPLCRNFPLDPPILASLGLPATLFG